MKRDGNKVFGTPFVYRENMYLVCLSTPTEACSVNKYRALRTQGKVSEADIAVLISLFTLKYASKFTCTNYIQESFSTIKKHFDKNFSTLLRYGLIEKYAFLYEKDEVTRQTPPIYCLSASGLTISRKLFKSFLNATRGKYIYSQVNALYDEIKMPVPILERVVFNQFRTSFVTNYKKYISAEYYEVMYTFQKCSYQFNMFRLKVNDKDYEFCVLPVRSNPNSEKAMLSQMMGISNLAAEEESMFTTHTPIFIIIAENELHATMLEASRIGFSGTSKRLCFYTTDVLCAGNHILDNLIRITNTGNGLEYHFVRFALKECIKEKREV